MRGGGSCQVVGFLEEASLLMIWHQQAEGSWEQAWEGRSGRGQKACPGAQAWGGPNVPLLDQEQQEGENSEPLPSLWASDGSPGRGAGVLGKSPGRAGGPLKGPTWVLCKWGLKGPQKGLKPAHNGT